MCLFFVESVILNRLFIIMIIIYFLCVGDDSLPIRDGLSRQCWTRVRVDLCSERTS